MLPDRVSNPGPLTYESGALPIALRGPKNNQPTNFKVIIPPTIFNWTWYEVQTQAVGYYYKVAKRNPLGMVENVNNGNSDNI